MNKHGSKTILKTEVKLFVRFTYKNDLKIKQTSTVSIKVELHSRQIYFFRLTKKFWCVLVFF